MTKREPSGPRAGRGARTPPPAAPDADLEALRERLREAEETIAAIRAGDVDAIVVGGPTREALYRLTGTDYVDLFEHSIVGEFVTWPSGGLKANAAFCRMLGYAREELESRTWREITHPEDVDRTERTLDAIRTGEQESARFVKRYVRKDGAVVWADESTSLRRDPAGRPLYFVSSAIDVTESHRAQEALLASEVRYRRLFESAKDGILILDFASGRIVDSNPFLEQLTGFNREELKGRTVWEIGMFSDAPDSRMAFETLRSNEYARYEDLPLRDRAGNAVEVEFISNTYLVGGAKVIQCNIRDISERRRLEKELRRKDALYLSVIENSTDLILLVDQAATVRFANPALEHCLGYAASEVVGRSVFDYFHPDEREQARQDLEAGARNGFPDYPRVRRIRHKDGSWRSFEYAVADLLQNPEVRGIVAVCRDVTERQKFESALAASERRYRLLAEQNLAGVLRTTVDGRILDGNPAAVRIFGYADADELRSRAAAELFFDSEDCVPYMDRLVSEGTVSNVEIAGVRKDGARITLLENGSLWRDDELGPVVVRTFFDVTDRVQLEIQYRHLQKMEAIGALAGGLAHDFNNILTVIGGYGEELLRDLSDGSRAHRYATEIGVATRRAAALTRQLLTFSRKQVLEPQVVDLNALASAMEGLLGRLLGEDTEIVLMLESRVGFVKADRGQLEQVMLNLAVNARDAMPRGGRFVVATRDVELDETSARARPSLAAGPYVLLEVSDTGIGMAPEVQSHIFEPFFTTKEAGKGTGLGLSSVFGIVKQSGGEIDVASAPGEGTTFRILLPRVPGGARGSDPAPSPPVRRARPGETVLVVEDDAAVGRLTKTMLADLGYAVLLAASGADALEIAASHAGRVDLLLTDVMMPGMKGPEVARRLLALRPGMRVLFMSGYAAEGILREVSDLGNAGLLQKPFTPTSLGRRLHEALDASPRPEAKGIPGGGAGPALSILHMDDDTDILEITRTLLRRAGHDVVSCVDVDQTVARYGEALAGGRRFDLVILDLSIPGKKGGVEAMKEILALDPTARVFACSGGGPAEVGPLESGFLGIVEKPFTPEGLDTIRRLL